MLGFIEGYYMDPIIFIFMVDCSNTIEEEWTKICLLMLSVHRISKSSRDYGRLISPNSSTFYQAVLFDLLYIQFVY